MPKKAKIDKYYWMRKAELISALKTVMEGGVPQKPQKQPTATSAISFVDVHGRDIFAKSVVEKESVSTVKTNFIAKNATEIRSVNTKNQSTFAECSGKGICEHGENKFHCKECV